MASLYISEYAELVPDPNGQSVQAGLEPALATQKVTVSGTTAASSAFNAQTRFVRLHCDGIFSYKFGTGTPAATTSDPRVAANATEFFGVPVNKSYKVAAITNT